MKHIVFMILLLFTAASHADTIRIAVAANMSYVMDELVDKFYDLHPDIKVQTTLAGSGKLILQIRHGAPYDLFLSADMKYPRSLYDDGLCVALPRVYAMGQLVLFSKKKRESKLSLDILKKEDISKIAIANPKTAPYGKASFEALETINILNNIKDKFVYADSISQTVIYATRATDAGLIPKSALYAPYMKKYKKEKNWVDIPDNLYEPIKQGIAILKSSKDRASAKQFYDFMLSLEAIKILKKYGYKLP